MKISIVGNISAGKSSVIEQIHSMTGIDIFLENLTDWKDILMLFYGESTRWTFTFHTTVLFSFADKNKDNDKIVLYERSPMCCMDVFVNLHRRLGNLNDVEYRLIERIYKKVGWNPDVFIYIKTDPEICFERMKKRGRKCEENITIEYLVDINDLYEHMIEKCKENGIVVITINGNQNIDDMAKAVINSLKDIGITV